MGLKVIACASSDEKLEFAKQHGAELALNYAKEDLKEGLRKLTGGKGADIVFDPVGGAYAEAALRSTAWEGRFPVWSRSSRAGGFRCAHFRFPNVSIIRTQWPFSFEHASPLGGPRAESFRDAHPLDGVA